MSLSAVVASLRRRRGAGPPAGGPDPGPGRPAPDLLGVDPAGEPVEVGLGGCSVTLLFLTSTCRDCRPIWAGLGRAGSAVVVVTPDPSTDSRRGVAALAPPGVATVMSSNGWHDYGVTGAPWRVEVHGGRVVASGSVAGWSSGEPAGGRTGPPAR